MGTERHESTSRTYTVLGALLGIGAPLGLLALRKLFAGEHTKLRKELRQERFAYWYMAITTPIVFGTFGLLLGRRHERLRGAQEQIHRMHDEFCAIAAHDLRNPIAALLLRLSMLREGAKNGRANVTTDALEKLLTNTHRLEQLVAQFLDATRLDAKKLEIQPVPTTLPECISNIVDRLRVTVGKHSLEIAVEGTPPAVMADPSRLDQIVTNLVENASKYSPDGTPISIAIRADHGGATLSVTDRGFGIARDELPHLFERFYQTERAREKKSGLGLGLYITKGLVDAHKGQIMVASEPDRGSTFSVWLPPAQVLGDISP